MDTLGALHNISGGTSHSMVAALSVCGTSIILYLTTLQYHQDQNFKKGFTSGQKEGYNLGYTQGKTDARELVRSITDPSSLANQYQDGLHAGIDAGYSDGLRQAHSKNILI